MARARIMSNATAAAALRRLGWDHAAYAPAVAGFQQGFALLGTALAVDGLVGEQTSAALTLSLARLDAGKPTASRYFSFSEFTCQCTGRCLGEPDLPKGAVPNSRIWVRRALLLGLDRLRDTHYPDGLTPTSGCRCRAKNEAVYRALGKPATTRSMHLFGAAADIPPKIPLATVKGMRVFAGIGYQKTNGLLVSHVDVRHAVGDLLHRNPEFKTPSQPATWPY